VSAFKDHFSVGSADYAAYRPTYPRGLVDFLAEAAPGADLALDCGCGTGQLSVLLAERFAHVIAVDASARQIESAEPHPQVEYRVAPAEASGLPDGSADLVVAAQAAHWFDLPAFYAEARRVARGRGIVALVTYGVIEMEEPVDAVVRHFYRKVVGPYWPPERRHVEEGYRSFGFPFDEFPARPLAIEVSWTLPELAGYVDTWSAVRAAEKALGREPVERFRRELAEAWEEPALRRSVRFPLSLRVGRVSAT
jgi:SAM-dependent methyltransferase